MQKCDWDKLLQLGFLLQLTELNKEFHMMLKTMLYVFALGLILGLGPRFLSSDNSSTSVTISK